MTWTNNTFDLDGWKLTLPVDQDFFDGSGDFTDGKAYEISPLELEGFEVGSYFYYDEAAGGMVFAADVDGAKTSSGTNYTRTELREMDGNELAAWTLEDGGTMSAHLMVTELAAENDGDDARVIVGQIHGQNDELFRLYYDESGNLYYANERTGSDGEERLFYFEDENGNRPNVSLGEEFSYIVDVNDGKMIVNIFADGQVYDAKPTDGVDPSEVSADWDGDSFYFKAGVYQGVNTVDGHAHEGTGTAAAVFFDIDYSHENGQGREAWLGEAGGDAPTEQKPIVEEPVAEEPPAAEEPAPLEPVAEEPPAAEEPAPLEPVAEELPAAEEPAPLEPVAEEPPAAEEPAPLEPVAEEPPAAEEPAPLEEPVAEEPPAAEEPAPLEEPVDNADETRGMGPKGGPNSSGGASFFDSIFDFLASIFGIDRGGDDVPMQTAYASKAETVDTLSSLAEIMPVVPMNDDWEQWEEPLADEAPEETDSFLF